MTNQQARENFEKMIEVAPTNEAKDKIRLVMEYFTNEQFRVVLQDYSWNETQKLMVK